LFTGAKIGAVLGMLLSGILCQYRGWESVFYMFGKNRFTFVDCVIFLTVAKVV